MSDNSSISTDSVLMVIKKLKCGSHRDSTKRNYQTVWRLFSKFNLKLDIKPETWEQRILLFAGYLINENKKAGTVRSYISAVKTTLRLEGIEINENQFLLGTLTRACKLCNDVWSVQSPIQKGMLKRLLCSISNYFSELNQEYLKLLYLAIFSTGYYGMFRIGELTSGSHPVTVKNVKIGTNKDKLMFILESSKTHNKSDKPQIVTISRETDAAADNEFCPFQILRNYLNVRKPYKSVKEPFFVFSDRSVVTPDNVRAVLHRILEINNFNTAEFSFHMLQAGRATDLLKAGVSVETIKKLGRWRSNCVYTYLR